MPADLTPNQIERALDALELDLGIYVGGPDPRGAIATQLKALRQYRERAARFERAMVEALERLETMESCMWEEHSSEAERTLRRALKAPR